MAIKAGSILELMLMNSKVKVRIGPLLVSYAGIKQNLDNPAGQNWYFKKGIESNRKRLAELEQSFITYQHDFNCSTVDSLVASKNELYEKLGKVDEINGHLIRSIVVSKLIASVNYVDELLLLKSVTDYLHDIDYYLRNGEELNKLAGL